MRRPRERLPFKNLLGGRILPRAVPDISATRPSTSLILRSAIQSSNFVCDMMVRNWWGGQSSRGVLDRANRAWHTALMPRSTDARSYYQASAHPFPDQPRLEGDITADVCVIGTGYTGLSAALELAE